MKTIGSLLLAVFLLGMLVMPAAAQEESVRLQFYSHPTQRFNVLVPPGWDNRSDDTRTLLVNEAAGERIYALAIPTADIEAGITEAVAQLLPAGVEAVPADTVNLTTGQWQQNLYTLPDGAVATLFAQVFRDVTYVIIYENAAGVQTFIQRVDAPVEDADGAAQALVRALALIGVTAQPQGSAEQTGSDYRLMLSTEDGTYTGVVHPSGQTTADITIAPDGVVVERRWILTVVRDFFVTPETSGYLYLGLAAVFVIVVLFVLSLIVRQRNLQRDEDALRALVE